MCSVSKPSMKAAGGGSETDDNKEMFYLGFLNAKV